MAIKRYIANADNTITNAYKEDFNIRGTGSNMGQADILEVFSLYAQRDSGSAELSRILVQFPVSTISSDRTAGTIPASGSVNFFLRLYNAEHTRTLPRDYKLTVNAVNGSWEEGQGLDMENYTDKTYDKIGSNWINANGTFTSASATLKLAGDTNLASLHGQTFNLTDSDGTSQTFTIDYNSSTVTGGTVGFGAPGVDQNDDAMAAIKSAINNITALDITASTITAVGDATSEHTLLIKQKTTGLAGNTAIDVSGVTGLTVSGSTSAFTGGSGKWANTGGDFYTDSSSSFEQRFEIGTEDLEIDVTTLVEQWINSNSNVLGSKDNHGFLIKLSGAFEASSSTNLEGAAKSYYTKKFFARSSEFFFKRPKIEARWDSSTRDNRGNFVLSSSALPAANNLNKLFLYNYFRGKLVDILGDSTAIPVLNLYYASGSVPEGSARYFRDSDNAEVNFLSCSRESTGVYKVTFSATSSIVNSTYPYLVDVWTHSGSEIHTGSFFTPTAHSFTDYNPNRKYVITMPNLKSAYPDIGNERFRLYVRDKNWSPNIFTKATSKLNSVLIESASYQVKRMIDNKVVIPYGTSSTNHTVLSYDVSGNYFDLDMSMLEQGYTYGISYAFYKDTLDAYVQQPYIFKIRVEKDEY
jgi:hypothetical protein